MHIIRYICIDVSIGFPVRPGMTMKAGNDGEGRNDDEDGNDGEGRE